MDALLITPAVFEKQKQNRSNPESVSRNNQAKSQNLTKLVKSNELLMPAPQSKKTPQTTKAVNQKPIKLLVEGKKNDMQVDFHRYI